MKQDVKIRIVVDGPLAGVSMHVQRGRHELLAPARRKDGSFIFDLEISVDTSSGQPNFLGPFAQGPKDARFVYVNAGTYAVQTHTAWGRRAKISLMSITKKQVEHATDGSGSRLETTIPGIGKDGGPICASVKGVVWRVARD